MEAVPKSREAKNPLNIINKPRSILPLIYIININYIRSIGIPLYVAPFVHLQKRSIKNIKQVVLYDERKFTHQASLILLVLSHQMLRVSKRKDAIWENELLHVQIQDLLYCYLQGEDAVA